MSYDRNCRRRGSSLLRQNLHQPVALTKITAQTQNVAYLANSVTSLGCPFIARAMHPELPAFDRVGDYFPFAPHPCRRRAGINRTETALTAHLVLARVNDDVDKLLTEAVDGLHEHFEIVDPTLQVETGGLRLPLFPRNRRDGVRQHDATLARSLDRPGSRGKTKNI